MSMQLEIVTRGAGRAALPLKAEVERALTLEDQARLAEERGTQASALKRITQRHHALARVLAGGARQAEAALIVGYTENRVSILMDDPAFKELIHFYRSMRDKEFRDVAAKLSGIASDALDLIEERLEDEEERKKISVAQALEIVKTGADRSGFGPSSSSTQVNIHVGLAERMEAKRREAREAAQRTLEAVPNE